MTITSLQGAQSGVGEGGRTSQPGMLLGWLPKRLKQRWLDGGGIHDRMEGPQEVEEQEHQEEIEGVVVEDGERSGFTVRHLRLLPRDPVCVCVCVRMCVCVCACVLHRTPSILMHSTVHLR